MTRSHLNLPTFLLSSCAVFLAIPLAKAQIGTVAQNINTISAYAIQKVCAQGCFQDESNDFCPNDYLGEKIQCATHTDCNANNYLATNDCYCRSDLQAVAQVYLTSCVKRKCSVGDVAIDASTAGSIYSQYCKEKGYVAAALPATVSATATTTGGVVSVPTATSGSTSGSSGSSGLAGLSTTTIVGIVVGSVVGLFLLSYLLKTIRECFNRKTQPPSTPDHKAVFPPTHYQEHWVPLRGVGSEIGPNDSISMVSGPARPLPSLVSGTGYPQGRW
ncbi:hypothetical protein P153DRAFT_367778 [Dothidotthia symphoricarpi CBS 119687]|uniref:Extracellular membrane protein CFEM domain-containing protein n=1 Tax=Dothidotthia symphoricarpi CBS 119687 TaxID=1392245 RepID=A0A6A6AA75_9PLEO|nr:uncharacterized protein P153DRAFT_367778 [Dothidotthia symphoricarpi CBS 119687]KAF2128689.1 hypothetical protein P153DRAFT_367778 [Dothidotthia symphoricarpi CBS 119687]